MNISNNSTVNFKCNLFYMNSAILFKDTRETLYRLIDAIGQLSNEEFATKIALLYNSSIGEHTRHIIELYIQLFRGYDFKLINYDARDRELVLQTSVNSAISRVQLIIDHIERDDIELQISTLYNGQEFKIKSNYYREVLYNLEHCIHHQAIIKIGLACLEKDIVDTSFGVAKSTLEYRK